jgi:hypothetical protein
VAQGILIFSRGRPAVTELNFSSRSAAQMICGLLLNQPVDDRLTT